MGELIKIGFHGEDFYESTVSARRIHELLEVKKDFTDWFKYHAKNMKLVEGVHYTKVTYKDRHRYEILDSPNLGNLKSGAGVHYTKVTYKDRHKYENLALPKLAELKSGDGDEKFCLTKLSSKKTGRGGYNKIEYVIPVRIAEHSYGIKYCYGI